MTGHDDKSTHTGVLGTPDQLINESNITIGNDPDDRDFEAGENDPNGERKTSLDLSRQVASPPATTSAPASGSQPVAATVPESERKPITQRTPSASPPPPPKSASAPPPAQQPAARTAQGPFTPASPPAPQPEPTPVVQPAAAASPPPDGETDEEFRARQRRLEAEALEKLIRAAGGRTEDLYNLLTKVQGWEHDAIIRIEASLARIFSTVSTDAEEKARKIEAVIDGLKARFRALEVDKEFAEEQVAAREKFIALLQEKSTNRDAPIAELELKIVRERIEHGLTEERNRLAQERSTEKTQLDQERAQLSQERTQLAQERTQMQQILAERDQRRARNKTAWNILFILLGLAITAGALTALISWIRSGKSEQSASATQTAAAITAPTTTARPLPRKLQDGRTMVSISPRDLKPDFVGTKKVDVGGLHMECEGPSTQKSPEDIPQYLCRVITP